MNLSGGQRQRIAIDRVLLKDAPILVLDEEATSALDQLRPSALLIQESLAELMAGKTVIAIAHRLSTIARMDRLVVLEEGRIAETGGHAQLVKSDGLYARLWARQTGGFLPDAIDKAGGPGGGGRCRGSEGFAQPARVAVMRSSTVVGQSAVTGEALAIGGDQAAVGQVGDRGGGDGEGGEVGQRHALDRAQAHQQAFQGGVAGRQGLALGGDAALVAAAM